MLEQSVELFIAYKESENNSAASLNEYRKKLKELHQFLKEQNITQLKEIETIHIDMFQAYLMKKNRSGTVSNKMSIIRSYFDFLFKRRYILEDPTAILTTVKIKDVDRKKKENLTYKEAEKLIEKTEQNSIPLLKKRNKMIMISFLFFGIRVSELCNLKVEDVNLKGKTLYINGKGGKIRQVPLFDNILPDIKDYLKSRKNKNEYFFNTKKTDKPLQPRATLHLIKHHVKMAKINKNIGCHSLRRTAATLLLEAGIDIRKIQIFLGHKSITTTQLYLNPDIEATKQEIREKSPFAKKKKNKTKQAN